MAPHSSTLAWKTLWTEEPGRLQSMGLHKVRHDWVTSLSLFTFMHWRRKWQPTPVFLPGESQGRRSLVGCRLWGCTESDTLKRLSSSSSRGTLVTSASFKWIVHMCKDADSVWVCLESLFNSLMIYIILWFHFLSKYIRIVSTQQYIPG